MTKLKVEKIFFLATSSHQISGKNAVSEQKIAKKQKKVSQVTLSFGLMYKINIRNISEVAVV